MDAASWLAWTPWVPGARLALLCAAAALLELDRVRVGQWALSRPLLSGPFVGFLAGDALAGTQIGVLIELLTAGGLPAGGVMPLNGSIAAAVGALLAAPGLPGAASLPAGLLAGWAFSWIEARVRGACSRMNAVAEEALRRGRFPPLGRLAAAAVALHAAASAAFLFAATLILSTGLLLLLEALPGLRGGLEAAYGAAPWVGFGCLLGALRPR